MNEKNEFPDLDPFVDALRLNAKNLLSKRLEGALNVNFALKCDGSLFAMLYLNDKGEPSYVEHLTALPHATIDMGKSDWNKVISGTWSIMSVVLAGRCAFPKNERRHIMQLSMLVQAALLA